jgi:glucosamine--fructose-6-phosphate aminotransferase (isomerizing)
MSWVEAELREQPAALERFLAAESEHAPGIVDALLRDDVRYLLIVSRGSSSNVARYMQYLFGSVKRLPVAFATPSLYTVYDEPPELGPAGVIGVSQSGASPDVVAVLAEARKQNRPTLAITNDPNSPLALSADSVLQLHAGEERAVAATKTYLNSIAAIALLSTADDPQRLLALQQMPRKIEEQIDRSLAISDELEGYRDVEGGSVVARGVNYGAAFEIALKIRELSGAQFEAFSSADLLHGPIAALKSGQGSSARLRGDRHQRRRRVPRTGRHGIPTRRRRTGVAESPHHRHSWPGGCGPPRDVPGRRPRQPGRADEDHVDALGGPSCVKPRDRRRRRRSGRFH